MSVSRAIGVAVLLLTDRGGFRAGPQPISQAAVVRSTKPFTSFPIGHGNTPMRLTSCSLFCQACRLSL
jgi:hypothetical protein